MPGDLEQLVRELVEAAQEASALGNRLTLLVMAAQELGALPLAVQLAEDAERLAYNAAPYVSAAALRVEQSRRGWDVSPVGATLAAGRCGGCLAAPVDGCLVHQTWCRLSLEQQPETQRQLQEELARQLQRSSQTKGDSHG